MRRVGLFVLAGTTAACEAASGAPALVRPALHRAPHLQPLPQLARLRGGASAAAFASTTHKARGAASSQTMASGAAVSAAVIGGINLLGCALTFAAPSLGERITDLFGTGAIVVSAVVTHARLGPSALLVPRSALVTAAVVLWGVRLASFLFYRALQMGGDKRLADYFQTARGTLAFWSVSALWGFLTVLPQTLLVARGSVPGVPLGPVGLALAVLVFVAIGAEALADGQKWAFKRDPSNAERWCNVGLWSECRHPNYAAELTTWSAVFALAAPGLVLASGASALARVGGLALASLSPAFVALIILRVSGVPIAEARSERRFGQEDGYRRYVRETPLLVPRSLARLVGGSTQDDGPRKPGSGQLE